MSSVDALSSLGALDREEALTALGRLLSQIPMDPRLAKTCVFACMLRSARAHDLLFSASVHKQAYYCSSLAVPLSNGQLMVNTHPKASKADLAHTRSTEAVKAVCKDCWHCNDSSSALIVLCCA